MKICFLTCCFDLATSPFMSLLFPSSVLHQTHAVSFPFPFPDPLVYPSSSSYLIPRHWLHTDLPMLPVWIVHILVFQVRLNVYLVLTPTSFSSVIPQTTLCCHSDTVILGSTCSMTFCDLWPSMWTDKLISCICILSYVGAAYFPWRQLVQYYW